MKFCFLRVVLLLIIFLFLFCVCFFILLLVLLVLLWFFVAWKMLAEFSFWFLKYSSYFFASPFAFLVCVCVCVVYIHTATHTFYTQQTYTHTRTPCSAIVRISIVLSSSLSSCIASCVRPIVVAALFVCCSCNCCWRRKHKKPCKAVERPWQMAAQYIQELIYA